jgi:putative holliday junction resolvase
MAIDYGSKRTGIAVSDPLQIIANGLDTVATGDLMDFLKKYLAEEEVEKMVVGDPLELDGSPAQIAHLVKGFVRKVQKDYPNIEIIMQDERYTSKDAEQIIRQSGIGQKKRRDKSLVDKISAVLILQEYMERQRYSS